MIGSDDRTPPAAAPAQSVSVRSTLALLEDTETVARLGGWELDLRSGQVGLTRQVSSIFEVPGDGPPMNLESSLGFFGPEAQAVLRVALTRCLEESDPFDVEVPAVTARARGIWVRIAGFAERDAGSVVRLFGFVQDVSARREAEDARRRREQRRGQAGRLGALGTLAGGIAHGFNNVLATILSHAELAADDVPADNPARARLDDIQRATMLGRDLVRRVLAFAGAPPAHARAVRLEPVVHAALEPVRAAAAHGTSFDVWAQPHLPPVMGDASQLEQVVEQLARNASQAIEKEGRVTIRLQRARLDHRDESICGTLAPGSYVRLEVSDTGTGMDEVTAARALEHFFTTRAPGQGSGLGLTVVQGIVRAHGGSLTIESQPGAGTTVKVFLPAADDVTAAPEAPAAPAPASGLPRGRGERVLLVDDEVPVAQAMQRVIERLGYRVSCHVRPVEALRAVEAEPAGFDLLVTDMRMPELTGLELAARVRECSPSLPVVLCTGASDPTPDHAPMDAVLDKPVPVAVLARTLHDLLHKPTC